jgi:hypothetical protein
MLELSNEEQKQLISKILNQKTEMLQWQYNNDNTLVELFYWHEDEPTIKDYTISSDTCNFNKEVSYVHSEFWSDGLQQDIQDKVINIMDEGADFDIDDIISSFNELLEKGVKHIYIEKIDE